MTFYQRYSKRTTRCDIRSDCKAASNRRFYRRFLSKEWEVMVIRRDRKSGDYKIDKV